MMGASAEVWRDRGAASRLAGAGEQRETKVAGFLIPLCRGADPQSKEEIERVVGYIKNHYPTCRKYCGISELNSNQMECLDRVANAKLHDKIKMIPKCISLY